MSIISGNIRKILFQSKDGYTVGLIKIRKVSEEELNDYLNKTITFTCNMIDVNTEIDYKLVGMFEEHPRFGMQFKATSSEALKPSDKEGIILYLSSGMFHGIGLKTATNIVEALGEQAIDLIKKDEYVLDNIYGLSKAKAKKLRDKLLDEDKSQELILELNKMGFSSKESLNIISLYQTNLKKIIEEDFYSLVEIIPFKKIDSIYLVNNEENDYIRIQALIPYIIEELCFKTGDTLVKIENVFINFIKYFKEKITLETFMYYVEKLNKDKILLIENDYLILRRYYDTEKNITKSIKLLNRIHSSIKENEITKYIEKYEKNNKITFNKEQKQAILESLKYNLYCITGGPGTGKTTIIKAIVDIYKMLYKNTKEEEIVLLAPTGRSAKKMCESVLHEASTIHKFLKWNKEKQTFGINEFDKSKAKLVIIDEASMIDIFLFDSLLKGLSDNVKIILLGDKYQLPSISPGNVLEDLLNYEKMSRMYLQEIYRTKKDSYILELANVIKNKEQLNNIKNHSDFTFIESNDIHTKKYLEQICDKYKGSLDDFQVLVPMYRGENGIDNLNELMQNIFNGDKTDSIIIANKKYKVNDKIIQLVNDVDNNVFNGDIGYITYIDHFNKIVEIDFLTHKVEYQKDKFDNFTHAYAISIHKSQGSEYDNVVIILSKSFKRMFYNKLIYTAVTRAKKGLIIIGELDSLNESIKNTYSSNRLSKLKDMLNDK